MCKVSPLPHSYLYYQGFLKNLCLSDVHKHFFFTLGWAIRFVLVVSYGVQCPLLQWGRKSIQADLLLGEPRPGHHGEGCEVGLQPHTPLWSDASFKVPCLRGTQHLYASLPYPILLSKGSNRCW